MIIELKGRIDSNNAPKLESEVFARLEEEKPDQVVMDAQDLEYISSAGLRLILRVKKRYPDLRITNVNTAVTITFLDHGIPYDPLAKQDPDVTASADDREIGGLGIFMTKSLMDDVSYEYANGQNILTLKKKL